MIDARMSEDDSTATLTKIVEAMGAEDRLMAHAALRKLWDRSSYMTRERLTVHFRGKEMHDAADEIDRLWPPVTCSE